MKRGIIISIFFVLNRIVFAQSDFSVQNYLPKSDSSSAQIGIWLENYYNSNVLNNSVYYNSTFKTGISRTSMQNMEARAFNRNVAGSQQFERLYYTWKGKSTDSSKLYHTVNFGSRRTVGASFSKNAFLLTGFGNKRFAGQKVDLGKNDINLQQWSQLQYMIHKQTSNKASYGFGIALLMGHQYTHLRINDSYLYTSSDGDSISIVANGYLQQSDTTKDIVYHPAGYGVSADFYLEFPVNLIKQEESKGVIRFELNELGSIFWNNKSRRQTINGQLDWSGIYAPSIFDLGDSANSGQIPTNLREEFVSESNGGRFSTLLSPRVAVYHVERLNDRMILKNMIDYRFATGYLPYIAATQIYSLTSTPKPTQWNLNIYESLGGYGYLGFGLGIAVNHKKFGAILGSRHVIAMANPEGLSGFNLHFGFNFNLN